MPSSTPSCNDLQRLDLGGVIPKTVKPLGWNSQARIYLITDGGGRQFVLKQLKGDSSGRRFSTYEQLGLKKEIASYKALPRQVGSRVLIPALVAHGRSHLLVEYVSTTRPVLDAVREDGPTAFAEAIAQFHWDAPPGALNPINEFRHKLSYAPEADAVLTAVRAVRKHLGLHTAQRCIQVLQQCRRKQPRLRQSFSSHNDLWVPNVLAITNGKFCLIDFASRTRGSRWVLDDIVRFGFLTRDMELTRALVSAYEEELRKRKIAAIHTQSQIRFALLRICMTSRLWKKELAESLQTFLLTILIHDAAFKMWLCDWESPFPRPLD